MGAVAVDEGFWLCVLCSGADRSATSPWTPCTVRRGATAGVRGTACEPCLGHPPAAGGHGVGQPGITTCR